MKPKPSPKPTKEIRILMSIAHSYYKRASLFKLLQLSKGTHRYQMSHIQKVVDRGYIRGIHTRERGWPNDMWELYQEYELTEKGVAHYQEWFDEWGEAIAFIELWKRCPEVTGREETQ